MCARVYRKLSEFENVIVSPNHCCFLGAILLTSIEKHENFSREESEMIDISDNFCPNTLYKDYGSRRKKKTITRYGNTSTNIMRLRQRSSRPLDGQELLRKLLPVFRNREGERDV